MIAQSVRTSTLHYHLFGRASTAKFSLGKLLGLALILLLLAVFVMLLLTAVADLAVASVPMITRDTRSLRLADYSPWAQTEFQPVRPDIVGAMPADSLTSALEPSGVH